MRKSRAKLLELLPLLPPLPGWISAAPTETLEAAAFRSGAALAHLTLVTAAPDMPSVNRPGFTGGQNSRRIARYGTDIKEENREAVFT